MIEIYKMETPPPMPEDGICDMLTTPGVDDCRGQMCNGCALANVPRHYVQACMVANGGSFAASLARSFQVADPTNYKRLRAAFPDIWERYAQMWIDAQPKVEA